MYSEEQRFKIEYRRKSKSSDDHQLPMIDLNKRVINFGDDVDLFKIVVRLIMKRVDLDPDDLDPLLGDDHGFGPSRAIPDLDRLSRGAAPAADDPAEGERHRRSLSEWFGLHVYRHPDRYGARRGPDTGPPVVDSGTSDAAE